MAERTYVASAGVRAPRAGRTGLRGQLARIRASLRSPQLIGESGARNRYMRVQWWVVFWRLLILVQIPEVALLRPERLGSLPLAFTILAAALAYTALYGWLAMRTKAAGRKYLQFIDLLVCASFMFAARGDKLLFIMAFYSFSSLLSRPTVLFREAVPNTVFLSLAYLGARLSLGTDPLEVFSSSVYFGEFMLYYFWGIGFVGFSGILKRASALELDSRLEEQRQHYRRRLHDDLGNTLCGLHFRIQSLKRSGQHDLKQALGFLNSGYERASGVITRILGGFDEETDSSLDESLKKLRQEVAEEYGLPVELKIAAGKADISPEVRREVVAIMREATMNAARHSGTDVIELDVQAGRGSLVFSVTDYGCGIDSAQVKERQAQGGMGITNMRRRTEQIGGELQLKQVDSGAGSGGDSADIGSTTESGTASGCTAVVLTVPTKHSGIFARMLEYDPGSSTSGIYPYLIRLRTLMFVFTAIVYFMQPSLFKLSLPNLAVGFALALDALAWVAFRSPLFRLLKQRPWLLVFEQLYFSAILIVNLRADMPFFFSLYLGVTVIMNGLFLGPISNFAMTTLLNAGLFTAHVFASAGSVATMPGGRYEEALQHMTIFWILAFSSGLAGEFVEGLESLQQGAVRQALARQRARLSADTHRQLYSLIGALGNDVRVMWDRRPGRRLERDAIEQLESRSQDLKKRLRCILTSLDEPPEKKEGFQEQGLSSRNE